MVNDKAFPAVFCIRVISQPPQQTVQLPRNIFFLCKAAPDIVTRFLQRGIVTIIAFHGFLCKSFGNEQGCRLFIFYPFPEPADRHLLFEHRISCRILHHKRAACFTGKPQQAQHLGIAGNLVFCLRIMAFFQLPEAVFGRRFIRPARSGLHMA